MRFFNDGQNIGINANNIGEKDRPITVEEFSRMVEDYVDQKLRELPPEIKAILEQIPQNERDNFIHEMREIAKTRTSEDVMKILKRLYRDEDEIREVNNLKR